MHVNTSRVALPPHLNTARVAQYIRGFIKVQVPEGCHFAPLGMVLFLIRRLHLATRWNGFPIKCLDREHRSL
jgi:hypothetical protein